MESTKLELHRQLKERKKEIKKGKKIITIIIHGIYKHRENSWSFSNEKSLNIEREIFFGLGHNNTYTHKRTHTINAETDDSLE